MALARKNASPAASSGRLPMDDHMAWQPIYDALVAAIGEPSAWAWFGHCRFIEREWDQLTISHWSGFGATESLKRHGYELAKAADVKRVKVFRSGGFRPSSLGGQPRQRTGFEVFSMGEAR